MARISPARLLFLPTADLRPNPHQPRRTFDETGLAELAASVSAHGILQPLTVRRTEKGWELIAGERRLRAAQLAGLRMVPCLERPADDRDSALLALVENLQRRDLHYFEEAEAVAAYIAAAGITQEDAAAALGRSSSALANKLRLLRLSPACRKQLTEAGLSERHARCLLRLEDEHDRLTALTRMAGEEMTVAQSEQLVERMLRENQTIPPAGRRAFILKDVRLFLNSLDRGLRLVREAGLDVEENRQETEEAIFLTLRIPKQRKTAP